MPVSASAELAYARETTPATAFDLLVDKKGNKVSEKELWCMATAIYFEARGESYRGQVAVGQVVMNRVAHKLYPNTICNVVFQNQHMRNACQFSFACDGIPERVTDQKSWAQAEEIAKGVINGTLYLTEVATSTHYHATYVYPHWAPAEEEHQDRPPRLLPVQARLDRRLTVATLRCVSPDRGRIVRERAVREARPQPAAGRVVRAEPEPVAPALALLLDARIPDVRRQQRHRSNRCRSAS